MKIFQTIAKLLLLFAPIKGVFAGDIEILYNRYMDISLVNPTEESVQSALGLLNPDGSFSDLDYTTTSDLSNHLFRLKVFGGAYQSVENVYYQDTTLKQQFYTSMQYWITRDHRPANWWFRHIGYPKELGPCLFLMNVEMQAEMPTLFSKAIDYLMWAYLKNDHMEGANGADKIHAAFPAAIMTQNETQLKKFQDQIKNLIVIQNKGEGIEPDWMYGQHSGYGRQLYGNYEHEYLNSILSLLELCQGTIYGVTETELTILDDHFINGNQWYVYNNHQDPSQTGRKPSSRLNPRFANNINMMLGLETPKKSEILIIQDRVLQGKNAESKLIGNRMFWRFDYMIHRRENYFMSSRVTSTRTLGMESGNGEGINNYYTSAGINFLFRTGNEYDAPFFSVMNFRQWPGTTVEQEERKLPLVDWGKGSSNKNAFAGGVSDDKNGAIGTIYKKKSVTAYKSWFYFDDEYVALGTGIKQTLGTASVVTTLNQTLQKSTIIYSEKFLPQMLETGSGSINSINPNWILQDSVGYINLLSTSNFIISSDNRTNTPIFSVGVDHGKNPKNEEYAYIVYPNISEELISSYKQNLPIQILSNTKEVQAVYHKDLKTTQAIFYKAGTLLLADGKTLTVNKPCAVMIKEILTTFQISVGNPLCETSNPASILITIDKELTGAYITWDGIVSNITIALPQGDYAGQSVTTMAIKATFR